MNPSQPPSVQVLIYGDPSVVDFLAFPESADLARGLLVETGLRSTLAPALDLETPSSYPGLCGLLARIDLGALAVSCPRLPAPIVLAPGTSVSITAFRSALQRILLEQGSQSRPLTLLVAFDDLPLIGSSLADADRVSVAWDINVPPDDAMLAALTHPSIRATIERGRFGGLRTYSTRLMDSLALEHLENLREILGRAAANLPLTPSRPLTPSS